MKTTLLTAAGSASASAALETLRAHGHRVVACDIYPRAWNAACVDADSFFQAVLTTDVGYLPLLEEAVRREGIDFLIPLTDVEVDALCARKADFARLGCTVCCPDEPCARLCRDKLAMTAAVARLGACETIPTASPYGSEPRDDEFPILLKPLRGRSSQGRIVARDLAAYRAALSQRADLIAQPFLDGDIYTVDVARDLYGNVQCLARQELLRTVNGLGTTVRVLPGHPLEDVCARIADSIGLVGVVNMEFICHGGAFFFLETNPRFSGGVGFSQAAGADFPWLQILCHQGEPIGPRPAVRAMTLARRVCPMITEK